MKRRAGGFRGKSGKLFCTAAALLILTSCAGGTQGAPAPEPEERPGQSEIPNEQPGQAADTVTLRCTIVDGAEEGVLLLAQRDGTGVFRLDVSGGSVPLFNGGESVSWTALEDGMTVQVSYGGMVLETDPAQFADVTAVSAEEPLPGAYRDLCGFYLQVLEDLWNVDPGLNSDDRLRYIGVDLADAPGELTESERSAVARRFAQLHGKELVYGTFAQLSRQGYIDGEKLQWEDGCLFSIRADRTHDAQESSLPALHFDAEKWRSGTGAYFFSDCSAIWSENGSWSGYRIGSEAIS